jgi:hypothetical protein
MTGALSAVSAWHFVREASETKAPTAQHAFRDCMTTAMLAIFDKKDDDALTALTGIAFDFQDTDRLLLASQTLLESVEKAYREKDQAERPVYDPQTASWFRHSIALRSVCDFLASIGAGQEIIDNIASISAGFYDLTMGLHPPMFRPISPGGGRKVDQSDIWAARAAAVIALLCFVASGTTDESKAARLIAEIVDGDENYRPLLRVVRSGSALESAILNWRKLLK